MARPARSCTVRGCPELASTRGRCRQHLAGLPPTSYGPSWAAQSRALRATSDTCQGCGRHVTQLGAGERMEADHIVPRSRGGTNAPTNLRVLCTTCHAELGDRSSAGPAYRADALNALQAARYSTPPAIVAVASSFPLAPPPGAGTVATHRRHRRPRSEATA